MLVGKTLTENAQSFGLSPDVGDSSPKNFIRLKVFLSYATLGPRRTKSLDAPGSKPKTPNKKTLNFLNPHRPRVPLNKRRRSAGGSPQTAHPARVSAGISGAWGLSLEGFWCGSRVAFGGLSPLLRDLN